MGRFLTGFGGVDEAVGVEVQDSLLKSFQGLIYFESRVTGDESGHKDIDASVVRLIVLEVGVDHFQTVVVGDSDLMLVTERVGDQSEEVKGVVDCCGGGFKKNFSELAPEAVEHEFGGGVASRVFLAESGFENYAFPLFALLM